MTQYGWAHTSSVYHTIAEGRQGWHAHAGSAFNGERWIDEWSETRPYDLRPCECAMTAAKTCNVCGHSLTALGGCLSCSARASWQRERDRAALRATA